jgi:hypothetical protein
VRQARGPGFESGLSRPVGRESAAQHGEEARGDVNDAATALAAHLRHRCLGHEERTGQVDRHEELPGLGCDVLDLHLTRHVVAPHRAHAERCIVDQQVEPAEAPHRLLHCVGARRVIGNIER